MPRSWIFGFLIAAMLVVVTGRQATAQGTRFRADWLFLTRDSDAASSTLIAGPDAFSSSADFNFESGYRLFFSLGAEAFDVEFQYSRLDEWQDQQGGRLLNELSFDNEFANGLVVAAPPANVLSFNTTLFTAAEFNGGGSLDETLEGELLDGFSSVLYEVETTYSDFEVTVKTSRLNWYRFGIGYRHIQFDEANGLQILGTFSAIDADDGAVPGDLNNDDNDILSHEALAAVGLVTSSGTSDGFAFGDSLLLNYDSANDNRLNGVHLTFDGMVLDSPYFQLDLFGNLGLYHNQITARLTETYTGSGSNDSTYRATYRDRENDMAWATQLGLRGALKLTDNWRFQVGYELLFIDGLALGPNQTRLTTFNTIPVGGDQSVFMHGGRLGFEGVW